MKFLKPQTLSDQNYQSKNTQFTNSIYQHIQLKEIENKNKDGLNIKTTHQSHKINKSTLFLIKSILLTITKSLSGVTGVQYIELKLLTFLHDSL